MQSTNELKRLENIIAQDISFLHEMNCTLNNDLVEDFKNALAEETENIKNRIMLTVCNASKKAELKRYIRYHQQNLIALSSHLVKYSHPEEITKGSPTAQTPVLCHYIYKSLEDLLNFVERHFTGYFNPDTWVPASYRLIAVQEISHDLETLEQNLVSLGVNTELISIVFLTFREFLDHEPANEITYRKVKYMKALKAELCKIVKQQEAENAGEAVRHLLTSLNLNSIPYFTYCTNFISLQVNAAEEQTDKLRKLAFCLKEINQVIYRHGFIFDSRYKPLKEQIVNWVAEELNFQEKNHQLTIFPESGNLPHFDSKLDLDLSVAQVACMLRGFVESKVIQNKNQLEVIRIIAALIKTKRSETVSPESLRMRYYNIEHSAKMAVISKLRAIADWLSRN